MLSLKLFSILQRYSFESNSQQGEICYLSYPVVFYLTKILIWKQFTTLCHRPAGMRGLFSILQRYSFESNSQRSAWERFSSMRCFLSYKDTHLKAIHNPVGLALSVPSVVFYLTKILIWKQFTTHPSGTANNYRCFLSYKDTHLKAIHNLHLCKEFQRKVVFYLTKILIWKQFTTARLRNKTLSRLFSILQR